MTPFTDTPVFCRRRWETGSALLAVAIFMLLVACVVLVAAEHLLRQAERWNEATSMASLAGAREALIGYALGYPDTHPGQGMGYLPCPDKSNDGSVSLGACNARDHGAMGRLPYRTLGLPVSLDGARQCLWYAVAGSFKNNPKALALNWDSPGQFRVVDTSGQPVSGEGHDAVAVILAPGAARPGQHRPSSDSSLRCPGSADAAADLPAFLDTPYPTDIAGNLDIVIGTPRHDVNDMAVWITVDDIFNALRRRPDFSALFDNLLDIAVTALQSKLDGCHSDCEGGHAVTGADFLAAQAEAVVGNRAQGRLPASSILGIDSAQADFYDNWRDQLRFVACVEGSACLTAVLRESAISSAISETETCRALVLFGGERLRGSAPQRRSTVTERADPAQYLEGSNLQSFIAGTGDFAGFRHYAVVDNRLPASEDLIRCVP
ncbi:MAG: hypothetical protein LBG78_00570 [Azoarcus sp.]|jgi:hypothetical protein|nr:hypothetical protein [Azoarcus sp.]